MKYNCSGISVLLYYPHYKHTAHVKINFKKMRRNLVNQSKKLNKEETYSLS